GLPSKGAAGADSRRGQRGGDGGDPAGPGSGGGTLGDRRFSGKAGGLSGAGGGGGLLVPGGPLRPPGEGCDRRPRCGPDSRFRRSSGLGAKRGMPCDGRPADPDQHPGRAQGGKGESSHPDQQADPGDRHHPARPKRRLQDPADGGFRPFRPAPFPGRPAETGDRQGLFLGVGAGSPSPDGGEPKHRQDRVKGRLMTEGCGLEPLPPVGGSGFSVFSDLQREEAGFSLKNRRVTVPSTGPAARVRNPQKKFRVASITAPTTTGDTREPNCQIVLTKPVAVPTKSLSTDSPTAVFMIGL